MLFGNNESAVDIRARVEKVQWAVAALGNKNAEDTDKQTLEHFSALYNVLRVTDHSFAFMSLWELI